MYTVTHGLNTNYISSFVTKTRTNYVVVNSETTHKNSVEKKQKNLNIGFKQTKNLGKTSKKKITDAVKWLDFIAKTKTYKTKKGKKIRWRIQMITLTLSSKQRHSDKEITKELLGKFLNEMRNNYDMKNYVWKAETQENGNIHYHIITDCGVNYYRVLYVWNRIQNYLGYVKEWEKNKDTDTKYPNSVDIKKVLKDSNIEYYIAKYIGKDDEEERRAVTSRLYALSYSLSRLKEFRQQSRDLAEFAYTVAVNHLKAKVVSKEFANYVAIELKRICAIWKDFKIELLKRLKKVCDLTPSKLLPRMELSEQSMLLFYA